jgi:hypothetical protein
MKGFRILASERGISRVVEINLFTDAMALRLVPRPDNLILLPTQAT